MGDLGLEVGPSGAVFQLAPPPVGRARFGAPGATRPLLRQCPRGGRRRPPRHARALVEPGHAARPASTTTRTPSTREGGLGDVGGEHHPSPPGRRGLQRKVLFGLRQRPGQRVHVHARRHRTLQQPLHPTDLPDAETPTSLVCSAQRPLHRRRAPPPAGPACPSAPTPSPQVAGRRWWRPECPHQAPQQPLVSGVADIASTRRSGRTAARASSVSASPRSRSRAGAFVHLVEDHQPHAVQGGVVL